MEPALDERGDLPLPGLEAYRGPAAMEPALDERGDRRCRSSPTPPRPGRNGARSRRAGRHAPGGGLPLAEGDAAMEPALDERGDHPDGSRGAAQGHAAMEPALDERGDLLISRSPDPYRGPQWSPLSTSGATPARPAMTLSIDAPQWSPLSTSGATRAVGRRADRLGAAAMEPALDERGDLKPVSAATSSRVPQWSPLSTSGATDHVPAKVDLTNDAAMEPALDERGDSNGRRRR